jgi:hypothetical protein
MDINLLEESLPESTREQFIAVGCNRVREIKLSVSDTVEELSDILYGYYDL